MRLVYSPRYDIALPLIGRLHPFDGRKYSRAWGLLEAYFGSDALQPLTVAPAGPAAEGELLRIHTRGYLESLRDRRTLARVLEVPALRWLPRGVLESRILEPMRWAVAGTCLAASLAREHGVVFQMGGGFHHAFRDHGEGFCVYADAALAVESARQPGDHIVVIDLDAHRGNGFESIFERDGQVHILDAFNFQIYPGLPAGYLDSHPYAVPFPSGTGDARYLEAVEAHLPAFLDRFRGAALAIYNAGTDIVAGDPLGQLTMSPEGVLRRDRFVIEEVAARGIPLVIVTSGGYTKVSHRLIFETARGLIESSGTASGARRESHSAL
jgi:histone deacetylase 11